MRGLRLKSGTKKNKYSAIRTKVDGITFDSKAEATRYGQLRLMERAHEIDRLMVHPVFNITYPVSRHGCVEEVFICKVELDFSYYSRRDLEQHYEDVKGRDNRLSQLKRKLVEAQYDIKVEIVK